jgi:hypothetical protein
MRDALTYLCACAAALLLVPGATAAPEDEAPKPLTAIEAGPLGRCALVLLGKVDDVRGVRDMVLARVIPEQVIKGTLRTEAPVTVLVPGPRPTLDRSRPSAPYLTEDDRGRYVFFLQPAGGGEAWRLETLFDAEGDVGEEKLASLVRHAALARIADRKERGARTLAYLLQAQRTKGTWTRVHAARELSYLADVEPSLFDADVRAKLRRLAARGSVPAQRSWLCNVLRKLGGEAPVAAAPSPEDADADVLEAALAEAEDASARIEILGNVLHRGGSRAADVILARLRKEEPEVRAWFVRTLAEGGYLKQLPAIRMLYAFESDAAVRRAIVYATGRLGGSDDVPWLAKRALALSVQREALFALARIRTQEALEVLARLETELVGSGASHDIPALVNYLRGPAFVATEAAAGRTVGPHGAR